MKKHFFYSLEGKQYLEDNYVVGNQSCYEIAEKWKTYANLVRRALKYHNIQLKERSEIQKNILKSGRKKHPTKGKTRDITTKVKISNELRKWWKKISPEEYQKRKQEGIDRWNNLTEEKKKEMRKKAAIAVQKASIQGSKLERYVLASLQAANFRAQHHKTHLLGNHSLEIDIFLPIEGIAIEIDGPAHLYPIWGEEQLKKTYKADQEKNGLLLTNGYMVVRIKNYEGYLSIARMRETTCQLISLIKELSINPPEKIEERYKELYIMEEALGK